MTVIMFNLDKLNVVRPKVRQGSTWDKGLIPESPDSLIESLVQRVNWGRFCFELGDSSSSPRLYRTQAQHLNGVNERVTERREDSG